MLNPLIQFGLAALVCVLVPFAIVSWFLPLGVQDYVVQNTLIACLAGLLGGFALHRSFSKLPGTYESFGILPGYLASFGMVLSVILLFRIEYTRSLVVGSFVSCIVWFLAVYLTVQRKRMLRLGVIEGGRTDQLYDLAGIDARRISLRAQPKALDAVVADFRFDHSPEWEARIADFTLSGIPVYHSKDLLESLTGRTDLEHLSENTFGSLGPAQSWLLPKTIIDRLVALVLLPILAPIFLFAAVAIALDSPGPVFFRQKRTGYRGAEFSVYKFRTMRHLDQSRDDSQISDLITVGNDTRITRTGRFLRFSRIDELPQLVNVLRGEMAIIGPRPEAAKLSNWYQAEVPFYRYRHIVRPGITGWAQVNQGHVADLADIKKKLEYDFYYIRNFSIWLDILIVMKTIKTVLTGFGHK